jgi:AcrR family transcriptional regulator
MSERVKSKRPYDSPRRREQAAATRREILAAAQRLFEQQGYAATTMAAIAAEARVALKTVYVAFETKSGVLRALWNLLLRGDEDNAPVAQRQWYRAVLEEPEPERQLRLNARNARAVKERAGTVLGVIRNAAPVDADIAALWRRIQTDFYDNQRAIVEQLAEKKALRPGLDVTSATDILWTLNHPDVWLLLVGERGWTPEQFERWAGDSVCAQLLGQSAAGNVARRHEPDSHGASA